jgi:hypothetical protein
MLDTKKLNPEEIKDFDSTKTTYFRQHVWDIFPNIKCPLVGTCLKVEDQRRIVKKSGYSVKNASPYEIHQIVMMNLNDKNEVSSKVERFINQKFLNQINRFRNATRNQLQEAWEKEFAKGQFEGLLYVIATRTDICDEFFMKVFGDIHMMSHVNMEMVVREKQKNETQKKATVKIARLLAAEKEKGKRLHASRKEIQLSLDSACSRIASLENKQRAEKSDAGESKTFFQENQFLKARLEQTAQKLKNTEKALIRLENEKKKTEIELFEYQATNAAFADEIEGLVSQLAGMFSCRKCETKCPDYTICSRRILIVGGMTKIKHYYKKIVESSGGEFDYHDGYMKGGVKNLEEMVAKSDLILCPVNCNSHNACTKVKQLSRKHNKSIKMLANSSLNTISNALLEN